MFKNKKGISPLIATVLIIGFTVALAAVIMTWGQTFTKSMSDSTEESTQIQLACAQDVQFGIDSVCYDDADTEVDTTDDYVKLTVRNDAGKKIEGITARFKVNPSTIGVLAADISDGSVSGGLGNISAFGLEVFNQTVNKEVLINTAIGLNGEDVSTIKEVELVPIIRVGERLVTCPNAIAKYGNVVTGDVIPVCTS